MRPLLRRAAFVLLLSNLGACSSTQHVSSDPLDGSGIVSVDVQLDQSVLSDVDTDSVALVEVTALNSPPGTSGRVHVALALDTSGSMEGRRMENALAAAHALVDRLDIGDRVTVVAYSDGAYTPLACHTLGRDRTDAHDAIDTLVPDGNTCLSCGLDAAYAAFAQCPDTPVERVVVISDGHANQGVVDAAMLAQQVATARATWGIETSTVGVGRLHDEVRMAALATAGAADYRFLHNSAYLTELLDAEIADLHATAVTNVYVTVRPGDGVVITGTPMVGGSWVGNSVQFDLGQMAVGERRQLAVEMSLPQGDPGRALTATVSFTDVDGRGYLARGIGRVERSPDPGDVEASINAAVVETFLKLRAAAAIDAALAQMEAGAQAAAVDTLAAERESMAAYASGMAVTTASPAFEEMDVTLDSVESADQTWNESQRGEVMLRRAVNNDRRRGVTAEQPMYTPGAMNLDELE